MVESYGCHQAKLQKAARALVGPGYWDHCCQTTLYDCFDLHVPEIKHLMAENSSRLLCTVRTVSQRHAGKCTNGIRKWVCVVRKCAYHTVKVSEMRVVIRDESEVWDHKMDDGHLFSCIFVRNIYWHKDVSSTVRTLTVLESLSSHDFSIPHILSILKVLYVICSWTLPQHKSQVITAALQLTCRAQIIYTSEYGGNHW